MPVDSPDGTGGLINILCYKSNNFAGDFVSHFNIDIETCEQCGGAVKVIASIEDPLVIQKILSHLNTKNDEVVELLPQQSRSPPQISLFE
ncbi:hypothetical protein [Paraglaciecola sp. MB-3u-78]|jgi:hypothetical protein|uniref:hypothetical protein n=1 Tax=Paraglaciecola sp. MB-3u-78 TaxID=2058332 RepID=UPI0018E2D03D|nr:hypothetical protein [Paraglaciecola sp. MB-3u-78]